MRLTEAEYEVLRARLEAARKRPSPAPESPDEEKTTNEIRELHNPIIQWCRNNGAVYIRARPDKESTIAIGACDFVIFFKGKVLLVECKTSRGKLRPEQTYWHSKAQDNGFPVHVIRSFRAFLKLVCEK
jgi:hypothetical protein